MSLRRAASDSEYSSSDEESVETGEYYDTDLTDSELENEEEEEEDEQPREQAGGQQQGAQLVAGEKGSHELGAEGGPTDSGEKESSERGDGDTKVSEETIVQQKSSVYEEFDAEGDDENEDVITVFKHDRGGGERRGKPPPPYEVPKQGKFYMHDDRLAEDDKPRKSARPKKLFDPDARKESVWGHDGYESLNQGEAVYRKPRRSRRSRREAAPTSVERKPKESSRRERRSRRGERGGRGDRERERSSKKGGRWPEDADDSRTTSHVLVVDKATGRTIKKEVSIKEGGSLRRSIRRNSRSSWASDSKNATPSEYQTKKSNGESSNNTKRSRRYLASKGIKAIDDKDILDSNNIDNNSSSPKATTKESPPLHSLPQEPSHHEAISQEDPENLIDQSSLNVNAAQFEPGKNKLSIAARPYQPNLQGGQPPRPPRPQYIIPMQLPPPPSPYQQQQQQQYVQHAVLHAGSVSNVHNVQNMYAAVPVFYEGGQAFVGGPMYGGRGQFGGNRRNWKQAGET